MAPSEAGRPIIVGRVAQVAGIADVAFGERNVDVAEPLGRADDFGQRGLARPWHPATVSGACDVLVGAQRGTGRTCAEQDAAATAIEMPRNETILRARAIVITS